MKAIYEALWALAKPYYERGRSMDIDHIEWMMHDALFVCEQEHLDDSILLPLVILHDVGYAEVPKDNPYKLDMRRAHMEAGAKIAQRILEQLKYPKEKIDLIVHFVSVHDNWAFGDKDIYVRNPLLGVFTDLDFTWMATPKGFPAMQKLLGKKPEEILEHIGTSSDPHKGQPFTSPTVKMLYERYIADRMRENTHA